jgi:hypothetical protein
MLMGRVSQTAQTFPASKLVIFWAESKLGKMRVSRVKVLKWPGRLNFIECSFFKLVESFGKLV